MLEQGGKLTRLLAEKNTTPPAILAATIANVLLVSYVWMAIREDNEEQAKDAVKKVQ